MAFGAVVLAVLLRRAGRVEVAQRGVLHAVDFAVPFQDLLEAEFRFAVRIDRNLPVVLADRNRFRLAEGRRGAREHEILDSAFDRRVGEVDAGGEVVAEVFGRILHRFADQAESREVHDRVEFAFAADLLDELAVGQVAEDEFRSADRPPRGGP